MVVPTKAEIELVEQSGDTRISFSFQATGVRNTAQNLRDAVARRAPQQAA
jgi:hypothetical protein